MKWRRISRTTKLLSQIFWKFRKMSKKCPFFSFRNSLPQIKIFKKTVTSVRGECLITSEREARSEFLLIQTEVERRRREAGVKQSMEIRLGSCMYVCMYVCGWVCMVFGILSRTKARSATNEVPKCRSPERALLRHHIIGVRLPTSARRAKLPK